MDPTVLAHRDGQRGKVQSLAGAGHLERLNRGGERVGAQEPQRQVMDPARDRADPAVQGPEGLREPGRAGGPVGQGLTGQHPDPDHVHTPGGADRDHLGQVLPGLDPDHQR